MFKDHADFSFVNPLVIPCDCADCLLLIYRLMKSLLAPKLTKNPSDNPVLLRYDITCFSKILLLTSVAFASMIILLSITKSIFVVPIFEF